MKMKRISIVGLLAGLALTISHTAQADTDGRTDLTGPGEAEVIAGIGYEHTLFDSADNKCQHCHNDLYDTWKKSMHAKSWADPIFQSKYQDFLRLQASKIGAVGPTGTYKEGTIQKSGQVCIKCHAPTAFYSGDYKITLTEVGNQNDDPNAYEAAKALQTNLAGKPGYDSDNETTVVSMAKTGKVYTVSYHIGNSHNREGINCAFCHSVETVRMMQGDPDYGDGGHYKLKNDIKMGPIGPIVYYGDDVLTYSPDAGAPDMNAFFALIGPEKYANAGDTPTDKADFDIAKAADGRYTMKSIVATAGCDKSKLGPCEPSDFAEGERYYTGGPFYGPFGVTGLSNSLGDEDASDRASLVNQHFVDAVEAADGDKFTSEHQFAGYGKALCLSCHQRSSLMLNPESNDLPGLQVGDDQFLELCSTWTAMSDGVGNNFEDTATSPKCQRCHMEPLEVVTAKDDVDNDGEYDDDVVREAVVLHQWDDRETLFTDGVTEHFDPESGVGPVAEGYLNNHAFMGANKADFGLVKIKTGFESDVVHAEVTGKKLRVETYLQNKTAHMFPGAHPMRRVLTRIVVTDANGDKLPLTSAIGMSTFQGVTNDVAVLTGNIIKDGFDKVDVMYDKNSDVVIQGYTPDLGKQGEDSGEQGERVSSQNMDQTLFDWVSPDATVTGSGANYVADCGSGDSNGDGVDDCWAIKGVTTAKKITDIEGTPDHFTRIYGRETGKRAPDGAHVVRPGFDSNIATDNRLKPNEREQYTATFSAKGAAHPLTVRYKVYYMKKGASGKFPTAADGFLNTSLPAATLKKLAIYEVFDKEIVVP